MTWFLLACAIASEVTATLSLRVAVHGRRALYAVVVAGYLASFVFLALTLSAGLGIGVAYGIWAATGIAVTAIASRLLFGEPLTRTMSAGIVLIIAGVLLIETGRSHT